MVLLLFAFPSSIPPAHAAGALFIGPQQQGPFPVGTSVTYQVNVTGMDPFNAWDIYVETNSSVLSPISISVAGNILGSVLELNNCVNGVSVGGVTGCTINDGAGVAHSAAVDNSGIDIGGIGLLFAITYNVTGSGFSFLRIPLGLDTIVSSGFAVVHSTSGGVYGTVPPLPVADFNFSPTVPAVGEPVTFNASLSSDPNTGARLERYTWTICPSGGGVCEGNVTSQPMMVHIFPFAAIHGFSITLVVTDDRGLSSEPVNKLITVTALPDFNFYADTYTLRIRPGHSTTDELVLQARNDLTGDVALSVGTVSVATFSASLPRGFGISFSENPVALNSTTPAAVVVMRITVHAGPGIDNFDILRVTATSGNVTHDFEVLVIIVPHA